MSAPDWGQVKELLHRALALDARARAQFLDEARASNAALRVHDDDWPDDAWKHWRYRRETLAHLLAQDGMMQQVADAYGTVLYAGGLLHSSVVAAD